MAKKRFSRTTHDAYFGCELAGTPIGILHLSGPKQQYLPKLATSRFLREELDRSRPDDRGHGVLLLQAAMPWSSRKLAKQPIFEQPQRAVTLCSRGVHQPIGAGRMGER